MGAYNQVNGFYNCENEAGLTGALRDDWGFDAWRWPSRRAPWALGR
jgi:beta-glucosidase